MPGFATITGHGEVCAGLGPFSMLKLSEKLPENEVCTSILPSDTVYFVKPSPAPGVFLPISFAKNGASAAFAGFEADALTEYRSFIHAPFTTTTLPAPRV